MIVVSIIGLLAAIAIPSFVKSSNTSQQNACINNLRQIDGGKEQAAMALHLSDTDTVASTSVDEYIKGSTSPTCPGGGVYDYKAIGTNPDCSITDPTSHNFAG